MRGARARGASRYSKLTFGLDPNTGEVIEKWINAGNTPPSFNNGAKLAFDKQKTENSFIEYKHFFSPDFSLQASYNRTHYKDHFLYGDIGTLTYTPEYNAATYTWGREKHSFTGQALDIFLDGKFKLFSSGTADYRRHQRRTLDGARLVLSRRISTAGFGY